MLIKQSVTRTVTEDEIVEVICDKCNDFCSHPIANCDDGTKITQTYGLINCQVSGGYGSPVFADGEYFKFSLCEKCLMELFKTFIHPPENGMLW